MNLQRGLMWHNEWIHRNMFDDFKKTKQYFTENPPEIGDPVIVLCTSSGAHLWTPTVTVISDITNRKRLIVNHDHFYAGKSFYQTGQNCYAPKGQCWLIPKSFYSDEEWLCYWKHIQKEVGGKIRMYSSHIEMAKNKTDLTKLTGSSKKTLSLKGSGTLKLGLKPDESPPKTKIKIDLRRNQND